MKEGRIPVLERAGKLVRSITKAEPLKIGGCRRLDGFPCTFGGGNCERRKNGPGYQITFETCHLDGISSLYEGETGQNGYTRAKSIYMQSDWKIKTLPS